MDFGQFPKGYDVLVGFSRARVSPLSGKDFANLVARRLMSADFQSQTVQGASSPTKSEEAIAPAAGFCVVIDWEGETQ
jgi:hypothetical protein